MSVPARDPGMALMSFYIAYEEIFSEPYCVADLKELTGRLPCEDAKHWLYALGAALDLTPRHERQIQMTRFFLQPMSVADRVVALLRSGSRDGWLHAGVIAAGWRAVALWGQPVPGPLPDVEHALTRWTFLLSDAYNQAQTEVLREDQPLSAEERLLVDIAFTLQNQWMHFDYVDFYALARQYALLFHMPRLLEQSAGPGLDLECLSPDVLGAPLLDYLALGAILFAWLQSRAGPTHLINERARAGLINLSDAIRPTKLDVATARDIVQGVSQTLEEFAGRCDAGHRQDGWYQNDWLRLRQWPLISLGSGDEFACALPRLVTEAFSLGIYYRFFNHFLEKERRGDNSFANYWGKLVEVYTGRLLRDAFPVQRTGQQRVWLPEDMQGVERSDAVLFYPGRHNAAVVVESVASHFRVSSLSGRDLSSLRDDLGRIVVKKVRQLSGACRDLFSGRTVMTDTAGGKGHRPELFVPVLVTWQSVPVWRPLMDFVDGLCKHDCLFEDVPHLPVQLMSMEELEVLLDSNRSVLCELQQRAQHPTGRSESMRNWFHAHGIRPRPEKRVPLLTDAFRDLQARIMRRLSDGSDPARTPM